MPAMLYRLRWPDSTESECYSPSLVIKDYFAPGTLYAMPEFLSRLRAATAIASERVHARFGVPCSRALGQLAAIELEAQRFAERSDAQVLMLSFHGEGSA